MRDTNDSLVAMTLQSLAVLVPLLGAHVVVGGERTKVFKRTTPNFNKSTEVTPETSPVHIVGASQPQIAQPSKVLNLFPRPTGSEGLVLSHMRDFVSSRETPKAITSVPDVSREMSLPLNGFHQNSAMEPLSYSPEQPDRLRGATEDWPDWSDPDSESRDAQAVQIHIQASKQADPASSRLPLPHQSTQEEEEEPWDDFEDTEATSDLSPTAPLSDPVILAPPKGGTVAPPAKTSPEAPRLSSSKPLKLTSPLQLASQRNSDSPWDSGWAQEDRDHSSNLEPKPAAQPNSGAAGGLGEEFTIKVKKKIAEDPELDLFADMVPDIKLSSAALLPLEEGSMSGAGPITASTTKSQQDDFSVDTVTLTAKFAVSNLTESETDGWGVGDDLNWDDENAW